MKIRWVGSCLLLATVAALAISTQAHAIPVGTVPDTQQLGYFSNANADNGEAILRITDPLEATQLLFVERSSIHGAAVTNRVKSPLQPDSIGYQPEFICAMIYVFDNAEHMQECCGCEVSDDGLLTIAVNGGTGAGASVTGSLNTNPVEGVSPFSSGVLRVVSATNNGSNQFALTNVDTSNVCDATGGTYPYGQYPLLYQKASTVPFPYATLDLIGNTRAWITHPLTAASNSPITETALHNTPLTGADADNLAETCGDVQDFGSGRGVCNCGNTVD